MSRKYTTTVETANFISLKWGAVDGNGTALTWASGKITVLAEDQTTIIVDGATATLIDSGQTLSWSPASMPDITATTQYFVRWRAVDSGGKIWYSRPLISWTVEPLP